MEEKLIYQRLADINKEVRSIGKNQQNQQQHFAYRGIDDVMNELHELFAKHEVVVLQEVMDFSVENRTTKTGSLNAFTRIKVKFTYATTDGSSVSTINFGEAQDTADKGMNKAMSIALKYSLTQLFLIPTQETKDPDAITPEETIPTTTKVKERIAATTTPTDILRRAVNSAHNAESRAELEMIWNDNPTLQSNAAFSEAMKEAGKKFPRTA